MATCSKTPTRPTFCWAYAARWGASNSEATLPPRLVEEYARLAAQPPGLPPAEEPDLTARELEVLNLIATGASNQEIAAQLSISLHTTKSYVRNILSKLHAVNRRQAARMAAQRGLLGGIE